MAGFGTRFKEAGFKEEKYAINFRGHSLLEWSVASLASFREYELVFVTREFSNIESYLLKVADRLGFNGRVIVLGEPTSGQAATAALAKPAFPQDDSILIFNTDTYVDPSQVRPGQIRGAGWIPTFAGKGNKWSFAAADASGRVFQTTEKCRISDHASIGMYYFDSFFDFAELVRSSEADGELYIAPLYNAWISKGKETYIHDLPLDSVTVLGTPEDLEIADAMESPIWPEACFNVDTNFA
jgi:dTDP-glucose pyrophosphorylase